MKNYFRILKLLLKDMLFRKEGKQRAVLGVIAGVYLLILAISIFAIYEIGKLLKGTGTEVQFATMLLFFDFIITIIFGTIAAISQLFLSKDTEFFLGLPVKPATVFSAKFTIVYLTEAALSVALMFPLLITAGIAMALPPFVYVMALPIALLVPFFSMALVALVSMPIVFLITRFKNRGAIGSVVFIGIFALVFGFYYSFIMRATSGKAPNTGGIMSSSGITSYIIYPIFMLMKFATLQPVFGLNLGLSMLVEVGIFLVCLAAFIFASYFLSLAFYNKLTSKMLENRANTSGKAREFASNTTFLALIKKELKEIVRNPTVAMQCVSGIILCPLCTIIIMISFSNSFSITDEFGKVLFDFVPLVWPFIIMFIMMLGVGTNVGSNTCISREGKSVVFLKILPISARTQIKVKQVLYVAIGSLSVFTGIAALSVYTIITDNFIWWAPLLLFANALIWVYFMVTLSIYLDLKNPRLRWKSVKEILKRGKNTVLTLIWMLFCMATSMVMIFLIIFGVISGNTNLTLLIFLIGLIITGLISSVVVRGLLRNNVERLFNELTY